MKPFAITIGRQLGAGGRTVGMKLSKALNITYFDKEILEMAARESGYSKEIFEKKDEKKNFFNVAFRMVLPYLGSVEYYSGTMSDETLFRIQSQAICKVAHHENCLFIGRAADYVLRENKRCLNIFLTADEEDRVKRIAEREKLDLKAAHRFMEKGDEKRADFYNFYSPKEWGEAKTYHLCINTSTWGIDGSVEIIKQAVLQKFPDVKEELEKIAK